VKEIIFNMLALNVPENLFLVCMTLMLMGRFDLLDLKLSMLKINIKWILLPIAPVVLIENFKLIFDLGDTLTIISFIIYLIVFYFLMVVVIKKNEFDFTKKHYLKIFACLMGSFAIMIVLQGLYVFILKLIGLDLSFLNNIYLASLMCSGDV